MTLNEKTLANVDFWREKGYRLPQFDRAEMTAKTKASPTWLHFGAGNIFKAFQADACQRLLDAGLAETGIIAAERREKKPEVNDNLTVKVTLRSDGTVEKAVVGSIAEKVYLYGNEERLKEIFESPSLQMVSFTITEKGYSLVDGSGKYLPDVAEDLSGQPENPKSYMGKITAMLRARYRKNRAPLAMVSMDNCAHNGDRLKEAVTTFAKAWGDEGFQLWLSESVSFPWSMIDKITPGPAPAVAKILAEDGLDEGTPFVNAEECEYLVIEDDFPNGRPPLEKAGIYMTDRETVDRTERMKVCTCLNPLHTAMAVFGCLLGFTHMATEIRDPDIKALVHRIGYRESLPVVVNPGILDPKEFIDAVLNVRIPNMFLPDMPQRIAADTSQKLPIRFGGTIRAYQASDKLDVGHLKLIPLVFAGWLRYLMAVDDEGKPFELSPDPLLNTVCPYVAGCRLGEKPDTEALRGLLSNETIFGVDLYEVGLAERVCAYFTELCEGPGAVRRTLHKTVTTD